MDAGNKNPKKEKTGGKQLGSQGEAHIAFFREKCGAKVSNPSSKRAGQSENKTGGGKNAKQVHPQINEEHVRLGKS